MFDPRPIFCVRRPMDAEARTIVGRDITPCSRAGFGSGLNTKRPSVPSGFIGRRGRRDLLTPLLAKLAAFFHPLFHFGLAGFDLLELFGRKDREDLLMDRFRLGTPLVADRLNLGLLVLGQRPGTAGLMNCL